MVFLNISLDQGASLKTLAVVGTFVLLFQLKPRNQQQPDLLELIWGVKLSNYVRWR